jgi:hypothetical protein
MNSSLCNVITNMRIVLVVEHIKMFQEINGIIRGWFVNIARFDFITQINVGVRNIDSARRS